MCLLQMHHILNNQGLNKFFTPKLFYYHIFKFSNQEKNFLSIN